MITLIYFWQIKATAIPKAIFFMATHRRNLRNQSGVEFFKLLGTGKGVTFTPLDADAKRWGILVTIDENQVENFESSKVLRQWRKIAISEYAVKLQPISSHGFWSKKQPFKVSIENWSGKIVAITRARIKWQENFKFWRAVPPVTKSLHESPGLIDAIGIGEAPIGLQGTFSIWQDGASLRAFAYKGAAHAKAIQATAENEWYAEELFARFAVIAESGQLHK
jgi:hypothetical protein